MHCQKVIVFGVIAWLSTAVRVEVVWPLPNGIAAKNPNPAGQLAKTILSLNARAVATDLSLAELPVVGYCRRISKLF